jgi:RimJ/RimL family protein N-acetyltransferase
MTARRDLTGTAFASARLSLRAFAAADAHEIFAAASPTISRFMTWDPPPSLAAFAEIWPDWLRRMSAGSELHLVIRLASTGEFLGVAGLQAIGVSEPTVGLWIKEAAHRRGYGRETIAAIIDWAAAHVGAAAVTYPVVEQNLASRRLAESLRGVVIGAKELRKTSGAVFREVVYRIPAPAAAAH